MSYVKHTWVNNEAITASKMNNIEDGIEEASQSGGGGIGSATVTVTHDLSELGTGYSVVDIYPTQSIVSSHGTDWELYSVKFSDPTTLTIPMFGESVAFTSEFGGNVTSGGGGGYARASFEGASGGVEIVDDYPNYGYAVIVTGDGTLSLKWIWAD